jgi:protein-tyrosine kinase
MDAIVRNIELTRLERERRMEQEAGAARTEALTPDVAPDAEVAIHSPMIVELSEGRRDRERIIAPGARGQSGAAYKMLRTQVLRYLAASNANTLAILSASSGEGKTLTAINLAIAIAAESGHTALLVDLDLRNPSIHRRLGIQPGIGIEDVLQHRVPVSEAMVKIAGYERLTVLPARGHVEQSSELLSAQRTAEVVQELRSRYANRVLIFDLPPVLLADDVLAFSGHVQAGLFVVAECKTERQGLERALRLLDALPVIGTVLNRSRERVGTYY